MNNNPTGINGYGVKNYPAPEVLRAALHQYAKEKLTVKERLSRLHKEHDLNIKQSQLFKLNKTHDVPSVRKPPPEDIATQLILEKVAEDPAQRNGVGAIGTLISNDGVQLPRDIIRRVLATFAPAGLAARFPGANKIRRISPVGIGANHQHHGDGHEKLGALALQMGGIGLPIYGIKDQWSGYLLHLVVVPDDRLATTIGHVHLDCVEKYGFIPVTFVTDKGSEIGVMYGNQTALRTAYAPLIDSTTYPPFLFLRSVHNIPIEGLWHWFLKTCGVNIKVNIKSGLEDGIYYPNDELHINLFNWLWPQILQAQLDGFTRYWNNHKIRNQKDKHNVSGTSPTQAFIVPEGEGGQDCRIPVDKEVVDALRADISVSREEAFRWVSDDFAGIAQQVFVHIGAPEHKVQTGWAVFQKMLPLIEQALHDV